MERIDRLSTLTAAYDADSKAHAFVQWVKCLAATEGNKEFALDTFERCYPRSAHLPLLTKAAVSPGTSTHATWAGPLVPAAWIRAFLELLRPRTVVGRLPAARRAPFNVRIITQSAGTTAGWIGEGKPTPAGSLAFTAGTLAPSKLGLIVLLSTELVRSADPDALRLTEQDLLAGVSAGTDISFLDPTLTAVANLRPASITFGTTETASTGATAAAVEADLAALITSVNSGALESPVLVMKPSTALALARLKDASGARAFPDVGLTGGAIWGIPVLISAHVGDYIVLLESADIVLADAGAEIDISTQGTVQVDSTPDDPGTAATVLLSLYQQNLVGVKVIRFATWTKRSATSAGYISGVTF